MSEVVDPRLAAWGNYYLIVGSAAAALIGIQFVVITLIAQRRRRAQADSLGAFGTPTVVHLTGALLISAIMCTPWPWIWWVSAALPVCGAGGLIYSAMVVYRALRQTSYRPVWEDWLWYVILPFLVYATLAFGDLFLRAGSFTMPSVVAATALALLLIAIHNAWDTVTHLVISGETTGYLDDSRYNNYNEGRGHETPAGTQTDQTFQEH